MSPSSLAIQVELESGAAGKLVLLNRGSTEVRLWRMGNSWGDGSLSFEASSDGRAERITYKPQIYTRNVPASVVVPPDGKYEIPFNLGDGRWEPAAVIDRLPGSDARLTAVFTVRKSPEALTQHVWIGELRSEPVRLK